MATLTLTGGDVLDAATATQLTADAMALDERLGDPTDLAGR